MDDILKKLQTFRQQHAVGKHRQQIEQVTDATLVFIYELVRRDPNLYLNAELVHTASPARYADTVTALGQARREQAPFNAINQLLGMVEDGVITGEALNHQSASELSKAIGKFLSDHPITGGGTRIGEKREQNFESAASKIKAQKLAHQDKSAGDWVGR